jgi:hypothetical protein
MKRGKYIQSGIGQSSETDEEIAVEDAISKAQSHLSREPTFTIVYTDYRLDQKKIAKQINKKLGKENWVGMTVDKHFNSHHEYARDTNISVLCIASDYVHFSVAYSKRYQKNARKKGSKTITEAVNNMHSTKNLDSYIAFNKLRNKDYMHLIRENQFLAMTFLSSAQYINNKETSGAEVDFVEGMVDVLGMAVPIFGGGAGSNFIEFIEKQKGYSHQFAHGKCLKNSAVVVFCVSNLHFEVDVNHSYQITDQFARITKLDKTGNEILEINYKEPIQEYCRLIGVPKKKYLKDPSYYSLTRPFGIATWDGKTFVKEALPNEDGKTFHSTLRTSHDMIINIMKHDEKKLRENLKDLLVEAKKKGPVGLAMVASCSTRRYLLGDNVVEKHKLATKHAKNVPFFGSFVFSEIGATKTSRTAVHGESITSLIFYDKLL